MATLLWRALALASLVIGVIGIFVPLLPTTPFLILSAWAAGKGWPQFEAWLLAHPRLGPPIRRWREHRAVPRRAKWLATLTMGASAAWVWASGAPSGLALALTLGLAAVAAWLWRRPEA